MAQALDQESETGRSPGRVAVGGTPAVRCVPRSVGAIILMILGVPVGAYYALGTFFMAGAVQQHDPSVSWVDVGLGLLLALAGISMFVTGIALAARAGKVTAVTPPG
jgi:predicted phage tail protein